VTTRVRERKKEGQKERERERAPVTEVVREIGTVLHHFTHARSLAGEERE
jgi:hypothetical protein